MKHPVRKILSFAAILSGVLIFAIGIWLCVLYVLEGIVYRIGMADQSLAFWYLPLLFVGVIGAAVGLTLLVVGIWNLKRK